MNQATSRVVPVARLRIDASIGVTRITPPETATLVARSPTVCPVGIGMVTVQSDNTVEPVFVTDTIDV